MSNGITHDDIKRIEKIQLTDDALSATESNKPASTNLFVVFDSHIGQISPQTSGFLNKSLEDLGFHVPNDDAREDISAIAEHIHQNIFNDNENEGRGLYKLDQGQGSDIDKEELAEPLRDLNKALDRNHPEGAKKNRILKMVFKELDLGKLEEQEHAQSEQTKQQTEPTRNR